MPDGLALPAAALPAAAWPPLWRRWSGAWRRWSLWMLLMALVASMLGTLIWLAERHEAGMVQTRLERDAQDAVADILAAFARNLQSMQALQTRAPDPALWQARAAELLAVRRELVRIEWRDARMLPRALAETPYRPAPSELARGGVFSEIALTCANARRNHGPAYARSYFQPMPDGKGGEMLDVCLPLLEQGRVQGFLIATYALHTVLTDLIAPELQRARDISLTETDGTRLALVSAGQRGPRLFSARQLLDLPGNTLLLRVNSWRSTPDLFPDVLTALVTAMTLALVAVLAMLVRDNRRRLAAESELGDALAFRKAMENSLVTGLRARDLHGRITYVNPAFCDMVGFGAAELLGQVTQPYWPPEHAQEYARRQVGHMTSGQPPPRAGYESTFMRKNGARFPVMIYEAPLINAHGQHSGWMGSVLDVGEQRRAEELSRASQQRLQATARLVTVGEMASLLSHELNQPLAAISSYATGSLNLLAPGPNAPAPDAQELQELRLAVQRIAQQAERAGRIIKSVHDFMRRREQSRASVTAQELFDDVLPLIRLQARELDVRVLLDIAPGLPPARCDRTLVEQVLLNLARNAMQAMDDALIQPRTLELGVRRAAASAARGWLEFSVADIGAGISADVAARLFTPFFTTRAEGMGLGLSLCRTVVEQHGGLLRHAARAPRGTVFTFTLPVAEDQ